MTAAEASELSAVLEHTVAKQEAADCIVASLERHLEGLRIAAAIQRERAHYQRLADIAGCPDCISMYDGGVCMAHNVNVEDL